LRNWAGTQWALPTGEYYLAALADSPDEPDVLDPATLESLTSRASFLPIVEGKRIGLIFD
jgi:hypothetical protein